MKNILTIIETILTSILSIFAPIKGIILIIIFAVLLDFIFAIYNAYKKGIPITSRRMYKTIPKLLIYLSVIIVIYYGNLFVFEIPMDLHKIIGGFILITEFKSIDENIKLILGFSLFNQLADFLSRGNNTTKFEDGKK